MSKNLASSDKLVDKSPKSQAKAKPNGVSGQSKSKSKQKEAAEAKRFLEQLKKKEKKDGAEATRLLEHFKKKGKRVEKISTHTVEGLDGPRVTTTWSHYQVDGGLTVVGPPTYTCC